MIPAFTFSPITYTFTMRFPGPQGATGKGYQATSTTSLTTGTGSRTFTTQANLAYTAGARIRATSTGSGEFMEGIVASYSGTSLVVTMDLASGLSVNADWNINLAGQPGGGSRYGDALYTAPISRNLWFTVDGTTYYPAVRAIVNGEPLLGWDGTAGTTTPT